MKRWIKRLSITLLCLFISVQIIIYYLPLPPLLQTVTYSRAIYSDEHRLLRLTLNDDEQYQLFTSLTDIPPQLIEATLLQEDHYFFWHPGINPWALVKAIWQTYGVRTRREGASTLTMQVARLAYGIHSKTIRGKLWQLLRAYQLELHYSKRDILEAYFNLAPYGYNIQGIGAASLVYFGRPVNQLNLPEALLLSVIPQNPSGRVPGRPALMLARRQLFNRWLRYHPDDRHLLPLIQLPLPLSILPKLPFLAPHFVNHVLVLHHSTQSELITTLDFNLQRLLETLSQRYLLAHHYQGIKNAAIMLVDVRDMSVKALVGSINFYNKEIQGQINGTAIKRSPGSTLKPFIYGLALDQGLIHPYTILKDAPYSFGHYTPDNFDGDFMGPITAKQALILSRNVPAIFLTNQLTHPSLYDFLVNAQVRNLRPATYYGLTIALGGTPLTMQELTTLYAMLANHGFWRPLRFLKTDSQPEGQPLLSKEASFLVLDMLKDTPRPGLSQVTGNGGSTSVAWKTGTSAGYHDAWTIGTFGPYVLAVWIGNADQQANTALIGRDIAAPLFFQLMDGIVALKQPLPMLAQHPEWLNLTRVAVCKASGLLPTRACPDTEMTWFIPGKSPIKTDNIFREIAINKKTGLRTCHINKETIFATYEFWPSDLLAIFKQAGMQRHTPPPEEPDCLLSSHTGIMPQITSPQTAVHYVLRARYQQTNVLPLTAIADAEVRKLFWFVNQRYLGVTPRDRPLMWRPKVGQYIIRVVDDHGRSDARTVVVDLDHE